MRSTRNRVKILSALSMAAAAATVAAQSAKGVSLSLYYGNTAGSGPGTAKSNSTGDGIWVGPGTATTGATHYSTAKGNLAGPVTQIIPNQTTPTTIMVAPGEYLSISINALITGDSNPDAGKRERTTGGKLTATVTQPANLGLSALGIRVGVSANDANGSILRPLNNGGPNTSYSGTPGYLSYASVNQGTTIPGGPAVPSWQRSSPGDVELNSGSVGANAQIFGGDSTPSSFAGTINELEQFSAGSAAYSNSTEFFQGLVYRAGPFSGVVTLSPFADTSATQYWSVLTPASGLAKGVYTNPTGYQATYFGSSDTVAALPVLVIEVGSLEPLISPIVILGSSPPNPDLFFGVGTSSGTLTVTGSNGNYALAQITGLNDVSNYVEATGWNPATDEEIYGLDVLVNGNQATPAQLATLINAINGDGDAPPSSNVSAGTMPVAGFPAAYNLFLTFPGGAGDTSLSDPDYLGIDLSSYNDPHLVGYSFSAVAALPEPMSLGLLAAGGLGLMAHRNRRRAR
jgi:hypothetical protein